MPSLYDIFLVPPFVVYFCLTWGNLLLYVLILQAYTNELENKVSRLEEENERLKKQKVPFVIFGFWA